MKKYKISFCTVCMNRLHHLKQTLPINIEDNLSYENLEFVVLNYNSKDEIDDWVLQSMAKHLDSGILKYYKTTDNHNYDHSHAKNTVAKCAEGDIICNIDADNYMGGSFASYLNQLFSKNEKIYVAIDRDIPIVSCLGRICVKSADFHKICGYDEEMKGYGFEDLDFTNRLEMLSLRRKEITNLSYLKAIDHNDEERIRDDKNAKGIEGIFISRIDYKSVRILYLFKDSKYCIGDILLNAMQNSSLSSNIFPENRPFQYQYSLRSDKWNKGSYRIRDNQLFLDNTIKLSGEKQRKIVLKNYYSIDGRKFSKIKNSNKILELKMFYSQISNRNIMVNNKKNQNFIVNPNGYGEAKVTRISLNSKSSRSI